MNAVGTPAVFHLTTQFWLPFELIRLSELYACARITTLLFLGECKYLRTFRDRESVELYSKSVCPESAMLSVIVFRGPIWSSSTVQVGFGVANQRTFPDSFRSGMTATSNRVET